MIRDAIHHAALLLVAIGVLRIGFLLLFRQPASAKVCGTDLTDAQRLYDADMHWAARCDGLPTPDDIPVRGVLTRIAYEVNSIEMRADVRVITRKGYQSDSRLTVWYDPKDARRVTAFGPGIAAWAFLLAGALWVLAAQID